MIESCDIASWVNKAHDKQQRLFREAVHIVLLAIATTPYLNLKMIMKGAVLLAVHLSFMGVAEVTDHRC